MRFLLGIWVLAAFAMVFFTLVHMSRFDRLQAQFNAANQQFNTAYDRDDVPGMLNAVAEETRVLALMHNDEF